VLLAVGRGEIIDELRLARRVRPAGWTAEGLPHYDIRAEIRFPNRENRPGTEDHPIPAVPERRRME